MPILIGQTQEASQKKAVASGPKETRQWDEASILSAVAERCGPDTMAEVERIMAWSRANADRLQFNTNPTWGSMGPLFERGGRPFYPFLVGTDGTIGVYFQYMIGRPVFDDIEKRRELLVRLNTVPGFDLPESTLTKRPLVKLDVFTRPGTTEAFLAVMDWFVAQLPARVGAES